MIDKRNCQREEKNIESRPIRHACHCQGSKGVTKSNKQTKLRQINARRKHNIIYNTRVSPLMLKMGAGTRDSPITIDDDSENEVLQELFNQSSKTIQSNHSHKAGKSAMADQAINYGYSPLSRDKSPIPLVQGEQQIFVR